MMKATSERMDVVDRQTRDVVGWHEVATLTFEGRTFTNGGAHVDPERATGYMADDLRAIRDWGGQTIGTARVTSSWPTPHSYVSSRMYQVEATISGRTYTGRTAGGGMLWRGRIKSERAR